MSYYFDVGGETVWNPGYMTSRYYLAMVEAAAEVLGVPSGVTDLGTDEAEVEPLVFQGFVDRLVADYCRTDNPVPRELITGVLTTSIMLLERAGREVTPIPPTALPRDAGRRQAELLEEVRQRRW